MQSSYDERFQRDMGCTEAEWLRALPGAMGACAWTQTAQAIDAEVPPGRLRIEWREGASFPYLGADLRLQFDVGSTGVTVCRDAGDARDRAGVLRLGVGTPLEGDRLRDLVHGWLQEEARRVFAERVALYAPMLGVQVSRISLSSARTRWGSASASGAIRLHWRLIHFSQDVIDYVVVHELAHLREMNHSPRFWAVVGSVLPGFEEARQRLKHLSAPA